MIIDNIYLRKATLVDVDLLYQWKNDDSVRKNSFQTKVIAFEEHKRWLDVVLSNENTLLYIMVIDNKEIGQVRVDVESGKGIITYSIDLQYRCDGYGKLIIQLLENEIIKLELEGISLIGYVKKENIASQKIFKELDYQCDETEDYFIYKKIKLKINTHIKTSQKVDSSF